MAPLPPVAYRRAAPRTSSAGTPVMRLDRFRRIARLRDERLPLLVRLALAALGDVLLLRQPFGDDDVRQRIDDGDVRARTQRQVIVRLDVRRLHDARRARIDDDQLRALAQAPLHLRGEHRMALGRIRADDHDDVRLHDGVEFLRAGRLAERVLQAVARGRVAHARAGIDVVVAERRAHQLLHEEGLLVRAARRGDAADRILAVLRLDALELAGGVVDRLVPGRLRATDR